MLELATESVEPALDILDALSTVPEGRAALKDCPRTIPNAIRLLMSFRGMHTTSAVNAVDSVSDGA